MRAVIEVKNLGKLYRLGEVGTGTLSHDLKRWWAITRGKEDPFAKVGTVNDRTKRAEGTEYVWALKDINFQINQGDVVGVIGKNGAGKSTLLKILSRITAPSVGSVKLKGRIGSLLEVGTGFHPEMTGRENVFMNGTVLGMRRHEITRKFDEIVDFAGVAKYIDTPVKRYSSGMMVRLGFAVAAFLEPEILIVDEVLAVGDAEFQKKALGKLKDVSKSHGRTVLFVSHNLSAISNLCTRGVLLSAGQVVMDDSIDRCLELYAQLGSATTGMQWTRKEVSSATQSFAQASLKLVGEQPNLSLEIEVVLESHGTHKKSFVAINIADNMGVVIMQAIPDSVPFIDNASSQTLMVSIELPPLIPATYFVSLWCGSHNTDTYDYKENILSFEILESPLAERSFPHSKNHGYVIPVSKIYGDDQKSEK